MRLKGITDDRLKKLSQMFDKKDEYNIDDYGEMFFNDIDRFRGLVDEHKKNIKDKLKDVIDRTIYDYVSTIFPSYVEPEGDKYEKEFVKQILYSLGNDGINEITDICDNLIDEEI